LEGYSIVEGRLFREPLSLFIPVDSAKTTGHGCDIQSCDRILDSPPNIHDVIFSILTVVVLLNLTCTTGHTVGKGLTNCLYAPFTA